MLILCYSLLKSHWIWNIEDFQQLSSIFGLLFDIDKASQYISKLEIKFQANTVKQEQVPVKAETSGTTVMILQSPLDFPYWPQVIDRSRDKVTTIQILWAAADTTRSSVRFYKSGEPRFRAFYPDIEQNQKEPFC